MDGNGNRSVKMEEEESSQWEPSSSDGHSLPQGEFQLEFEYNENTMEIEPAPKYPFMSPISDNFDDLEFLTNARQGKVTINIINPDGREFCLQNLQLNIIAMASSILATSFQQGQLTIYFPQTPVIALLRGIYQGDYTFCEAMIYRPIPLLLHFQVLALATKYRIPTLLEQAHANSTTRLSANSVDESLDVQDICASIKFLYTELRAQFDLRQSMSNYCVVQFPALQSELFRQTAFESPAFHRDLQHANFRDLFSQPHASSITQLPVCEHWIHDDDLPTWQGINDFTCQFHSLESGSSRIDRSSHPVLSPPAIKPASQVTPHLFNRSTRSLLANQGSSANPERKLNLSIRPRMDQPLEEKSQTKAISEQLPFRPVRLATLGSPNTEGASNKDSLQEPDDWNHVPSGAGQFGPEEISQDQSNDWVTVDSPSENTADNLTSADDYDLLSSDSEWSMIQ